MKKQNRDGDSVTRIAIGHHPGQTVTIFAWTAKEIGVPTVEIAGDVGGLYYMNPETAEALARGLLLAAELARGEQALPVTVDDVRKAPANDA